MVLHVPSPGASVPAECRHKPTRWFHGQFDSKGVDRSVWGVPKIKTKSWTLRRTGPSQMRGARMTLHWDCIWNLQKKDWNLNDHVQAPLPQLLS